MNESGTPKRDAPDDKDFEGEPEQSDQQGEEAPKEVADPDRKKDDLDAED